MYDNLKKFILFTLPTNGGEALRHHRRHSSLHGSLPLTPVQVFVGQHGDGGRYRCPWPSRPARRRDAARLLTVEPLVNGFIYGGSPWCQSLLVSPVLGLFLWLTAHQRRITRRVPWRSTRW